MRGPQSVVVVGAGLAGLAAAHGLRRTGEAHRVRPVVFEASSRVGGKLATWGVDGFLIEEGADGFVPGRGLVERLAAELGIAGEVVSPHATPVRAYLRTGARFVPLLAAGGSPLTRPATLLSSPALSWPGRARVLLEPLVPRRRAPEDESVRAFLRRRFGRSAFESVFRPLVSGVYGADPDELSAQATLPALVAIESRGGSVLRHTPADRVDGAEHTGQRTFRQGMAALPEALARGLAPGDVRLGESVEAVVPEGGGWGVRTSGGAIERFDAAILAVPAPVAARLLPGGDAADALARLPTAETAVVTLAYRSARVGRPLDAHGYLNAPGTGRGVSGCTWSSVKLDGRAPPGGLLLRAFVRGADVPPEGRSREGRLIDMAREEVAESLELHAPPDLARATVWSVPVYRVGHAGRVAAVRARLAEHAGLALAGASYDGVGIEAVLASGLRAAEGVLEALPHGATA